MDKFLFNTKEVEHFKNLLTDEKNKDYLFTFRLVNLILPAAIVGFTLLVVGISSALNDKPFLSEEFWYTVYNGSLPLIGINVLLIGLFSWANYDKEIEKNYGVHFPNLRTKLSAYLVILLLVGGLLYFTQATLAPVHNDAMKAVEFFGSLVLIFLAWLLSKRITLLEADRLINVYSNNFKGEKHLYEGTPKNSLLLKRN